MKQTFELIVNGDRHKVACAPDTTLLDVLRHDLDLKGTRFGCGLGLCGACFVLLDGHPTPSCDTPMWAAEGRSVVTVEGLAAGGRPSLLQRAFLDEQAAQCGFCVSGILISATALLADDPRPDEAAVRAGLDRNLCRCGVHERMTAAVLRAAAGTPGREAAPARQGGHGGPPAGSPAGTPAGTPETMPRGLAANPRLSRWVSVAPDGTVTVRIGKVELGQGILTALAQIAADELDVDLARLRMVPASTAEGPDEGLTAGSMSVADSGSALRQACAEVRALFVAEAVAALALDPATVTVRDGVIGDAGGGGRTTYGDLAARVDLDRDATGTARPKAVGELRIVGTSVPRLDLPDKIMGRPRFIHDLVLPGQLYGRVVRPPAPQATLAGLDTTAATALPGVVSVVRDGGFLGVVATDEATAERAAAALADAARWLDGPPLPDEDELPRVLRAGPTELTVVDETTDGTTDKTTDETTDGAEENRVVHRLRASYSRPFLAHASMAPSCGIARWDTGDDGTVHVWSHSQGVHALRRAIATVLGLDDDRVTVRHVEGAGAYGHNGADDAALDAVLLARSVPGRPVQVRWSRRDELAWAPFGSAMAVDVEAGLDAAGRVSTWSYDVWSQGHAARPGYAGTPGLLAAAYLEYPVPVDPPPPADPPPSRGGGATRNAVPCYAFRSRRIHGHRALRAPVRSSALRSLGAFMNVFAIESFMDELALTADRDPLGFRLAHLTDPRARDVLSAAAELGRWRERGTGDGVGHGIGLARYKDNGAYCAVVAEVEAVHEVRVRRLALAVDVGRVVNPDGVRNQIEGGAVQATSWTLKERVRFDRRQVTSTDWVSYPILRFSEAPHVDVHVLDRPGEPSVGAGEAAQGPTAAAIANALADALGVRVRDLPLTTEHIMSALDT